MKIHIKLEYSSIVKRFNIFQGKSTFKIIEFNKILLKTQILKKKTLIKTLKNILIKKNYKL